jgi:hypothetical protein
MERKPQQQTLSIRISDALREFLERSKQVISNGRGEQVSISDVAKTLLESAKDDRLDFRLEVADLQQNPTQSLWQIRQKLEQKQDLSRAQWIFLSQYIQIASEEGREGRSYPAPAAFCVLLEAILAVRGLRADRGVELDRYYLSNIGSQEEATFNDRQLDSDLVPRVTARWLQQLRESQSARLPVFAGRNFYVAVRDEELPDIVALNRVLLPHVETLFRLAARGHWMREKRPVISLREPLMVTEAIPSVAVPGFRLTFTTIGDGDLLMGISMHGKGITYPIGTYPRIREFSAMLEQVSLSRNWNGDYFYGAADQENPDRPPAFHFYRHQDNVTIEFSDEEWQSLKNAFAQAAAMPKLQKRYQELSLVYGEL